MTACLLPRALRKTDTPSVKPSVLLWILPMAARNRDRDGLIVATVPEAQERLMCIQYPGFVDNVDRAISSLGGIKTIAKVYNGKSSVLEARFRPEDRFSKPAVARPVSVTSMVLRVRRRRRRGKEGERGERLQCQVEILGMVKQSYEFTGMADFQVLAPGLNKVCFKAETLDPSIFQITEPYDDTFQSSKVPLFLPPWTFSKFDKPSNYAQRPDFQHKVTGNQVPGSSRQRRQVFAIGIPFDHKEPIPSQPRPDTPPSSQPKLESVKKLFEERPVWSRGAIQCRINLQPVVIRSLLALVSYYFTNGPWKMLWVRFGYDPRSTPDSKPYQCLDYRIPREIAMVASLESRRNKLKTVHVQGKRRVFQLTGDQESVELAEARAECPAPEAESSSPVFTADQLPSQRQLYYQLCDLRDDSLQAIVHANDGRETECTEANGWCEDGAYDKLRKTLGDLMRKTAEKVEV